MPSKHDANNAVQIAHPDLPFVRSLGGRCDLAHFLTART